MDNCQNNSINPAIQQVGRPDLIRIATCFGATDAKFLATYMEAHGVRVEKTNDHFINAAPVYTLATGGIELWVRGSDAPLCADLMEAWLKRGEEPPRYTARWAIALLLSFWTFFLFGVGHGWPPPPRSSIFAVAPHLVRQLGGEA